MVQFQDYITGLKKHLHISWDPNHWRENLGFYQNWLHQKRCSIRDCRYIAVAYGESACWGFI